MPRQPIRIGQRTNLQRSNLSGSSLFCGASLHEGCLKSRNASTLLDLFLLRLRHCRRTCCYFFHGFVRQFCHYGGSSLCRCFYGLTCRNACCRLLYVFVGWEFRVCYLLKIVIYVFNRTINRNWFERSGRNSCRYIFDGYKGTKLDADCSSLAAEDIAPVADENLIKLVASVVSKVWERSNLRQQKF